MTVSTSLTRLRAFIERAQPAANRRNPDLKLLSMPSNSAEFHNEAFHLAYEAVTQNLEYNEWVSRGMLLKDIIITLNFIEDTGVESQAISTFFSYALIVIKCE